MYIYEYTYRNIVYVYVCARVAMCSYIYVYICAEVIGNNMYTYIYIRRTYVRMDASNNNMYAWGAAVSITTCRERVRLTRPTRGKKERNRYVREERRPYGWWKT